MDRYYDADGVDITEKVKAQFQTQIDAKAKELQDQMTVITEENKKLKDKDTNFQALQAKYDADKAEWDKKFNDLSTSVTTDKKNDVMRRFTGGNKEVTEKIENELKALGLPMTNNEQIETAIKKAAAIVGIVERNVPANVHGQIGGRGTANPEPGTTVQETPEQREVRLKMGITDAMASKYAPQDGTTPLIIDKPAA